MTNQNIDKVKALKTGQQIPVPDKNAEPSNTDVKMVTQIGGTMPDKFPSVHVSMGDIYPSLQEINKYLTTFKYADAFKRYWAMPFAFDANAYKALNGAGTLLVTLPALPDQRHVIEQIVYSLSVTATQTLTITDGNDIIYQQLIGLPAAGQWQELKFTPARMQRVTNQPLTIGITNPSGQSYLYVNSWRF